MIVVGHEEECGGEGPTVFFPVDTKGQFSCRGVYWYTHLPSPTIKYTLLFLAGKAGKKEGKLATILKY